MAKIELTEKEERELAKLRRSGLSKGEALIKMGKAVRVMVDVNAEAAKTVKPTKKKERPVDPDKSRLMDLLKGTLESDEDVLVFYVTNREIEFKTSDGEYTMTLVKHKVKQEDIR